jgi:hypothetical protein
LRVANEVESFNTEDMKKCENTEEERISGAG